jgi:Putative Ig domain/IPT/TIG domain
MASAQISTTIRPAYIWNGSEWVQIGDGGSGAAEAGSSISVSASAPVSAVEGSAWFDNTDGKFYVYDGTFWVESAPTDAAYASYNRWTKVLSGSASIITGLSDNGVTLDYTPGQESLYINGIFIDRDSYTATSGSSIILDEISFSGDVIEIVWLDNIAIADIANIYLRTEQDNLFLTQSSASNTYTTLTQFNNIDLTSTINTASAAAYASASAYTDQAILQNWVEDIDGNLLPNVDNLYSIGSSAYRVKDLYLGASSLYIQSPNSASVNIAIQLDDENDLMVNNSKIITIENANDNLDLSNYLTLQSASQNYLPIDALLSIPYSASAPLSPDLGDLWLDAANDDAVLKVWNGGDWIQEGARQAPVVTSVNPYNVTGVSGSPIDITGSNFRSGLYVLFIGTDSVANAASQIIWYNSSSARAIMPTLNASGAPYDVRVVNSDNTFGELLDSFYTGSVPAWETPSGQIASGIEGTSFSASVQALDADLHQLTYALKFDSSLPNGVSLSSSGVVSGTYPAVVDDTTYSFTVRVSDPATNFADRLFTITSIVTNYFGSGSDGEGVF